MIILGPKTATLGPQFCRILVLGPHFWWSGGAQVPGAPWIYPWFLVPCSACYVHQRNTQNRLLYDVTQCSLWAVPLPHWVRTTFCGISCCLLLLLLPLL